MARRFRPSLSLPAIPGGLHLRLYVVGKAPNSVRAIANARALCAEHFASGHELEIVDLLLYPSRAAEDAIIVTPTLLKLAPDPTCRVIGNLDDTQQLLVAMGAA